jgi:hypothetical protein
MHFCADESDFRVKMDGRGTGENQDTVTEIRGKEGEKKPVI